MSKRPSDLSSGGLVNDTWVVELDAPTGGSEISETQKRTLAEVYDIITPNVAGWTTLTLLNGWTGEAYSRLLDDGYLEIFLNVIATYATDDQIATLTAGVTPDYKIISFAASSSSLTPYTVTVETDSSLNAIGASGDTVIIATNFKSIRLKP